MTEPAPDHIKNLAAQCGVTIARISCAKVDKAFCYIEEMNGGEFRLTYSNGFMKKVRP